MGNYYAATNFLAAPLPSNMTCLKGTKMAQLPNPVTKKTLNAQYCL